MKGLAIRRHGFARVALGLCLLHATSAKAGASPQTECEVGAGEPMAGAGERPVWAAPGVPDSAWRMVDAASVAEDGDRRKCLLEEAERITRTAVDADPESVDTHFALAVVLGLRADREGGRTKVRAASQLHEELRTILAMDPEHARAKHLLGRLHAGVMRMDRVTRWIATRLLGGGALREASWEEAEASLAFAEQRLPDVLDHHFELGRLYLERDRESLGIEELRHVLSRPASSAMEVAVREKSERLLEEVTAR